MHDRPFFSLILCVKDGMPYLPEAVDSVVGQSFTDFEVIVQDSESNDGSLEYLQNEKRIPNWSVISERDAGIGDGYNRAVNRCRGKIIGSIDTDNLLKPDALAIVAKYFSDHPHFACAYGSVQLIACDGKPQYDFHPNDFDYLSLLQCELVPPFSTSFFVKDLCGKELQYDASLATCADYDLWLRISHLPIGRIDAVLGCTRLSDNSMTCQPHRYEEFVRDKCHALQRHCELHHDDGLQQSILRKGMAGIYAWAAESVFGMVGPDERYQAFCARGFELDRSSWRLHYQQQKHNLKQLEERLNSLQKAS